MAEWTPVEKGAKDDQGRYMAMVGGQWRPASRVAKNDAGQYLALFDDPGTAPAQFVGGKAQIPGLAPGQEAMVPKNPNPPLAAPANEGFLDKLQGVVQAARATVQGLIGGTVGSAVGLGEGLVRAGMAGKYGTPEGASMVEATAAKRAQQLSGAGMEMTPTAQRYMQEYVEPVGQALAPLTGHPNLPVDMAGMRGLRKVQEAKRAAVDAPQAHGMALAVAKPVQEAGQSVKNAGLDAAAWAADVNPRKLEVAGKAVDAGLDVPLHAIGDSTVMKATGEALAQIPKSGSKVKGNRNVFTRRVIESIDPESPALAGENVQLDPKTYGAALSKTGKQLGDNLRSVDVPMAGDLDGVLATIADRLPGETEDTARVIGHRVGQIRASAEQNGGVLPGDLLHKYDSEIGGRLRQLGTSDPDQSALLHDIQSALRDAAESRMSPEMAEQTRTLRQRYARAISLMAVSDDIKSTGYIEPGKLAKVISKNKVADKLATTGRGNAWTDLAEAGDLIEPEGAQLRGRVIGTSGAGIGLGGMYLSTGAVSGPAAAAAATGAYGAANLYNRAGPKIVKALVKRERARNAPPEPPPERPLTTSPGAGGGGGEPRGGTVLPPPPEGPLGPAGPDLTTSPGAGGVEIPRELSPVEQALAARAPVLDELTIGERAPSRIIKSNDARGTVERRALRGAPAVEGRPDLPPEMVAGDLADRPGQSSEVASNTAAGTTGAGRGVRAVEGNPEAMRSEGAVLGREKIRQDRFAAAGGTGQPGNFPEPAKPAPAAAPAAVDPRLAEIEALRAKADSPAVQKVLDKREAEVRRAMKDEEAAKKREADADALDAAAKQTQDAETKAALRAEAAKMREAIPTGEVKEGFPAEPKGKAEKIPVGRTKEVPLPAAEKAQGLEAPMPLPETTEIAPEVVEGGPRPPVGEATEIEPVPVGQADELLPVGQADEVLPVGDAAEMLPAPEAIEGPPPIEPAPAPKKRIIAPPGAPPAQAPMTPAPKPPHTKMQAPQVMYRSVSPEEWEHIQKTGKITGGGNTFNGFENRGDVFFGAEPTEKLMAQGEEVMRRAEYQTQHGPTQKAFDEALAARQAVRDEMAAARKRHTDAGVSEKALDYQPDVRAIRKKEIAADAKVTAVQTQARTEISDRIKQLREVDAKRGHTSVLLETKPVEGGRRYTGKHSGMGDEDEFGFDPGQITAGDIVKVKYVKDGKVIREEPGPGATPTPKPIVKEKARATRQKPQPASVQEQPQGRAGGQEAKEAGPGDRVQRAAEGGREAAGQEVGAKPRILSPNKAKSAERYNRLYGDDFKAAAQDVRDAEHEFHNEFGTYGASSEALAKIEEDLDAVWSRAKRSRDPAGYERAKAAKITAATAERKAWNAKVKAKEEETRQRQAAEGWQKAMRQDAEASLAELRQLHAQGRVTDAELDSLTARLKSAEGMEDAIDEVDGLISSKSVGHAGLRVDYDMPAVANEPLVPEATKPDNAPAKRLIQPRDQGAKNVENQAKIIKPARKNSEILADLNRQIDERMADAHDGTDLQAARDRAREPLSKEENAAYKKLSGPAAGAFMRAREGRLQRAVDERLKAVGRVTVRSGGTSYTVANTREALQRLKDNIAKSPGFSDRGQAKPAFPRNESAATVAKRAPKTVVQDFVNDGDFENAQALAEHYGIDIKAGMDLKQKKAYQDWADSHPLE